MRTINNSDRPTGRPAILNKTLAALLLALTLLTGLQASPAGADVTKVSAFTVSNVSPDEITVFIQADEQEYVDLTVSNTHAPANAYATIEYEHRASGQRFTTRYDVQSSVVWHPYRGATTSTKVEHFMVYPGWNVTVKLHEISNGQCPSPGTPGTAGRATVIAPSGNRTAWISCSYLR